MEAPAVPLGTAARTEINELKVARRIFRIPDDVWDYLGLGIDGAGNLTIPPTKALLLTEVAEADGIDRPLGQSTFVVHGSRMGLEEEYDIEFTFRTGSPHTRENARIKLFDEVSGADALRIVYNLLHRIRERSKGPTTTMALRGLRGRAPAVALNTIGRFVAGPPAAGAPQGGRKTRKLRRKSKKTSRKSKW